MPNLSHTLRWSAAAGLLAALLVVVMLAIGLSVGPDLAVLEQPATTIQFGTVVGRHAGAIQAMMVVDNLFVVAYVTAFLGLAALVRPRAPLAATIGLGFALLTALFDFAENSLPHFPLDRRVGTGQRLCSGPPHLVDDPAAGLQCAAVVASGRRDRDLVHRGVDFWQFICNNVCR